MAKRNKYPLMTSISRIDFGIILMGIGLFFLSLLIIVLFFNSDASSLTFSTTVGFIGSSCLISGSILVSSVQVIEQRT